MLFFVIILIIAVSSPGNPNAFHTRVFPCSSSLRPSSLETFRCYNGTACVDIQHVCDGVTDCPDGSDENLCPHYNSSSPSYLHLADRYHRTKRQTNCGPDQVQCPNGSCASSTEDCGQSCSLNPDQSIQYSCRPPGAKSFQSCGPLVPTGTVVNPQCVEPIYYSHNDLVYMTCNNGVWDNEARCELDCGRVTPEALQLVSNGRRAKRGELPWHVGIYTKTEDPYKQICGGSLVSNNAVISAAHCFWNDLEGRLPPSLFAVAVGKLHRLWKSQQDEDSQESDVKEILIPEQFQGTGSTLQADLAVLLLVSSFEYKSHVKPICLNFDKLFDRQQLRNGNSGKVAGWGLTSATGPKSEVLNVVEMPFIGYMKCITSVPQSFKQFITLDKFCAGHTQGIAVCRGDSGGGLAFSTLDKFIERYYLRGIVSAAPSTEQGDCNVNTYATFTKISIYGEFIKDAMQGRPINWAPALITREDDIPKIHTVSRPSPRPADCGLAAPASLGDAPYIPWHVGIYRKTSRPYKQVCGGSLISDNVVLSAANCFWNDMLKRLPASSFSVAVGKIYRSWNNAMDANAQKSEISDIIIPPGFQGGMTRFENDIAGIILASRFTYTIYVRPICLHFDMALDNLTLKPGNYGKVAGWGATTPDGSGSQILKVIDMPYVSLETCTASFPPTFLDYVTSDKFCAGYTNGTALCPGDGGGGIAFQQIDKGRERYYLRGIVSAAPPSDNKCNLNTYVLFTQITKNEKFIQSIIN